MQLSKRTVLALGVITLLAGLLVAAPQGKAPAKGQKKFENTDTAQRLKWFEQHTAMTARSVDHLSMNLPG